MTDRLKAAQKITGLFKCFSLYFAVLASILYFISHESSQYMIALLMLLPFGVTIYSCIHARNMMIYMACHMIFIVLLWILQNTPWSLGQINTWVLTAVILFQMILFLSKRVRAGKNNYFPSLPPLLAIAFFILWIFANGMGYDSLAFVLVIAACVYMLSCVLDIYLKNMTDYIDSNQKMANMPAQALIHAGNSRITVFMLLGLTAVLLFTNMGLNTLFEQLKNLLLSGIRFLFSFAPNNTEEIPGVSETTAPITPIEPPIAPQDHSVSPVMEAVSNIFITVVQIALIIGAVLLGIYIIYQIWQRFNGFSFQKKKSIKNTDSTDVVEKLDTSRPRRQGLFREPSLPKDRIRRIYYKKIQGSHKKESVDASMTPEQLTASLNPKDGAAAREFTRIYEQARYSDKPPAQNPTDYKNLAKKL